MRSIQLFVAHLLLPIDVFLHHLPSLFYHQAWREPLLRLINNKTKFTRRAMGMDNTRWTWRRRRWWWWWWRGVCQLPAFRATTTIAINKFQLKLNLFVVIFIAIAIVVAVVCVAAALLLLLLLLGQTTILVNHTHCRCGDGGAFGINSHQALTKHVKQISL